MSSIVLDFIGQMLDEDHRVEDGFGGIYVYGMGAMLTPDVFVEINEEMIDDDVEKIRANATVIAFAPRSRAVDWKVSLECAPVDLIQHMIEIALSRAAGARGSRKN